MITYARYTDVHRAGLIEAVSLTIDGRLVKRARYAYCVPGNVHGPAKILARPTPPWRKPMLPGCGRPCGNSATANDLTNDVVAGQSETTYDRGGNAVLLARFERLPGSAGTGPLQGPGGAEPRARRSYLALYADSIGRNRFTADFGTPAERS